MPCHTENRPYLLGTSDNGTSAILYRPDCKQWSCDHCARRRKAMLANKTYTGYEFYRTRSPQAWHMITITSHRKLKSFEQTLYVMPKAWAKQKEHMRRRHNKRSDEKWRYAFVPELHQDGRVHMHLISNCQITERELKDTCAKSGFGYIAEVSEIRYAEHAAWYVSKYIGKQLDIAVWPPNFRRIRFTNHWPDSPSGFDPQDDMNWEYVGYIFAVDRYADEIKRTRGFESVRIVSQS